MIMAYLMNFKLSSISPRIPFNPSSWIMERIWIENGIFLFIDNMEFPSPNYSTQKFRKFFFLVFSRDVVQDFGDLGAKLSRNYGRNPGFRSASRMPHQFSEFLSRILGPDSIPGQSCVTHAHWILVFGILEFSRIQTDDWILKFDVWIYGISKSPIMYPCSEIHVLVLNYLN